MSEKLTTVCFVDQFSSLDDLTRAQRRDPKALLAALAQVGRFSCFEVDRTMAKPITWLLNQSGWVTSRNGEKRKDADGFGTHWHDFYPWTYVGLTPAGRAALEPPDV